MKEKNKLLLASVIIVNYNNKNYIQRCINSIKKQSYKIIEIIFVDDHSTDNSFSMIRKSKSIKIIKTTKKKRTYFGSYNQMNSYYEGFVKSKGQIIFFLDSDDFFKKNKVKKIINRFNHNPKVEIIFDLPILVDKNKSVRKVFKQRNTTIFNWPRYTSQSCISVRRNYAKELFNRVCLRKFPDIWFDFRIACYSFIKLKKIEIFYDYLTFYRIKDSSASSKFKTFNKNWWKRRYQAHNFFDYLCEKNNEIKRFTLDKLITNLINIFI